MNALQEVLQAWRRRGVQFNPSATAAELARLEDMLGCALPADVRRYFSTANGMEEYEEGDESLTCFWSIEQIAREQNELTRSGTDDLGPFRDLAFGDVMIRSWFFYFRVRPPARVSIFVEGASLELPTLDELFRRYLEDRDSLELM